jgi:hypothetical protein
MASVKTLDSVDALNRILETATAFWKSQTFFTACQLGVFEALGESLREAHERVPVRRPP